MSIERLLANNQRWASRVDAADPDYFNRLSAQQTPEYLWIGCADSRVPANQVIDLDPGEVFVHRNVANLVVASDLNVLSVLEYAVAALRVRHVIVCGHYGCGGVTAALRGGAQLDLTDHWLQPLRRLHAAYRRELAELPDERARIDRLCELNVMAQVDNVAATPIVQSAWRRGQELAVHGLIYGLADGRLRDLGHTRRAVDQLDPALRLHPADG
jgi:carbonic anhydrase